MLGSHQGGQFGGSRDLPRLAVCASPLVTVLDGHPHTPAFLSAIKLGS